MRKILSFTLLITIFSCSNGDLPTETVKEDTLNATEGFIKEDTLAKTELVEDEQVNEANEDEKDQTYQAVVSKFIANIKNKDKLALARSTIYPLKREQPLPDIKNEKDLVSRFYEVFDEKLRKEIKASDPEEDWDEMGYRGIMFKSGSIWLDSDGNLIAVNYQSDWEKNKRERLLKEEKEQLHESLMVYDEPAVVLETKKFRIRIDGIGDGFRYASWSIEKQMSEEPDLVIENGEIHFDGSGGNHRYEFVNGVHKYVCSIIRLGKDDVPANLSVYKGEEEILSQDAIIIRN